jgi:hypothetical protein
VIAQWTSPAEPVSSPAGEVQLTVMVALIAFCLLAFASVGLNYAPAAVALCNRLAAHDRRESPRD